MTTRAGFIGLGNIGKPMATRLLAWDGGATVAMRLAAVAIFVVAAASDRLDGWLARRAAQVTDVGKILDPIADKALMGGALVTLSALGELSWWVTVVILPLLFFMKRGSKSDDTPMVHMD